MNKYNVFFSKDSYPVYSGGAPIYYYNSVVIENILVTVLAENIDDASNKAIEKLISEGIVNEDNIELLKYMYSITRVLEG